MPTTHSMPARPKSIAVAGALLITLGTVVSIQGIRALAEATSLISENGTYSDLFALAGALVLVVGAVIVVFGALQIIAGAQVLRLRNKWRIVGIVLSALAMTLSLPFVIGSFRPSEQLGFDATGNETKVLVEPDPGFIAFNFAFLLANAATVILLARRSAVFRRD